jgi:hypothetical protein
LPPPSPPAIPPTTARCPRDGLDHRDKQTTLADQKTEYTSCASSFIQRDLAQPIWRIVFHAVWIYAADRRMRRFALPRLALCHLHHLAAYCVAWEAICVGVVAFAVDGRSTRGPPISSVSLSPPPSSSRCRHDVEIRKAHHVLYLLADTIWTWQFSHRQQPGMDRA